MKNVNILWLSFLLVLVRGDENGRLLASKHVLNQMLIEGKDVTVEYNIFNVGGSPAVEVELNDDSYDTAVFEVTDGNTQVQWSRIAPGSNVSHVVILKPVKAGKVNFTSASVTYRPSQDSKEKQVGHTSSPGGGEIMNYREYDRRFSPHVTDWAVFGLMTLPSLGMPFLLWHNSKSKYEMLKVKKN